MNFWQAISNRKSCRSFDTTQDVPDAYVRQLIEAAIRAPTAGNIQPWHFFVVRDQLTKNHLAQAALDQNFIAEAPVAIIVCVNQQASINKYNERGSLFAIQDTAAAIQNILLAATALGLGSCWVGAFNEFMVIEILSILSPWMPVAIIPIGYPLGKPIHTTRHSFEEVTTFI
jgi:nitroreductase